LNTSCFYIINSMTVFRNQIYFSEPGAIRSLCRHGDDSYMVTIAGDPYSSHGPCREGDSITAKFHNAYGIAVDHNGDIYVSDITAHCIRKIYVYEQIVTTVAGQRHHPGKKDGDAESEASFYEPAGIVLDGDNNLIIADSLNHCIRKFIIEKNKVVTIAGIIGIGGYRDGHVSTAEFDKPMSVAIDIEGNIFVCDMTYCLIRKIDINGFVYTIAGVPSTISPTYNYTYRPLQFYNMSQELRDGYPNEAKFNLPTWIVNDKQGNLIVADQGNNAVRIIYNVSTPHLLYSLKKDFKHLALETNSQILSNTKLQIRLSQREFTLYSELCITRCPSLLNLHKY